MHPDLSAFLPSKVFPEGTSSFSLLGSLVGINIIIPVGEVLVLVHPDFSRLIRVL